MIILSTTLKPEFSLLPPEEIWLLCYWSFNPLLVLNIRRPCSTLNHQCLCGCNEDHSFTFTFSKRNVVILVLKVAKRVRILGAVVLRAMRDRTGPTEAVLTPVHYLKLRKLLLPWGELREVRGRSQTFISQTYVNLIASRPLKVVEKRKKMIRLIQFKLSLYGICYNKDLFVIYRNLTRI